MGISWPPHRKLRDGRTRGRSSATKSTAARPTVILRRDFIFLERSGLEVGGDVGALHEGLAQILDVDGRNAAHDRLRRSARDTQLRAERLAVEQLRQRLAHVVPP